MPTSSVKFLSCGLILLILVLGINSFAFADNGYYLGIGLVNNNPGKGFTSNGYYEGGRSNDEKPAVDPGIGFEISGGYYFNNWAMEISYITSGHNPVDLNDYNATLNLINLDLKAFFPESNGLRPYALIGLNFPWMVVNNGASDDSGEIIGNATYQGFGMNFGGGLEYKATSRLIINSELIYRWINYTAVSDPLASRALTNSINGSGLCFNLGVNFLFNAD